MLDGRHRLELAKAHMPGVGLAPSGPMATEDDVLPSIVSPVPDDRRVEHIEEASISMRPPASSTTPLLLPLG
jgi:hypothetical protein